MQREPQAEVRLLWRSTGAQLGMVLLPAVVYYALLLRFYTSVPIIDDYWFLIAFALKWKHAAGAAAHLGLVLHTQVGPYNLVLDHALIALQLACLGRLSFPAMIFAGNLLPLGIFALLWKNTPLDRSQRYGLLALLPVSLLFFSLNYAELLDWAVATLQIVSTLLFVLMSLHFLVKEPQRTQSFVLACVFGLLGSTANANGVLVWPAGVLFLLADKRPEGKRWGRLAVLLVCAVVSAMVYREGPQGSGLALRGSLVQQGLFFLSFCGGGLENMHHRPVPYLSMAIGAGVLVTVLLACKTRYDRRNPFFFYAMLWILMSAAVAANGRAEAGLQGSLSSRYKVYCDLLLIFCYQYWLDRYREKREATAVPIAAPELPWRLLGGSIAAALLFCLGADYAGGVFLATRKQRANTAMRAFLADPATASPMFLVEDVLSPGEVKVEDLARQQLNEMISTGMYVPPAPDHLGLF